MAQVTFQEETADVTTPATTKWRLYFKSTGLFVIDDAGVVTGPLGGISDGDKGDVTVSSSGTVWTIDAGSVTLAKIVDATGQYKIMARSTAGAGDWEEVSSSSNVFSILAAANYAAVKSLLSLNNVDNTSDANKPVSTAQQIAIDAAVVGLLDFKGTTDASTNPNYPSALKGDAYIISVAGKVGGASGTSVEVGDWYIATADNAGGTEAAVGTSWAKLEHNVLGALVAANNLSDVANASTARTNLGLAIGTNVQAYHARLADIAGLTYAQGDILYFNGVNIVNLGPGISGYFLKTQGAGANPIWAAISGGGDALVANPLSQFAATTSAQLAGVISDETGSDKLVFNLSPTLVTPTSQNASDSSAVTVATFQGDRATPTDGDTMEVLFKLSDSAGNQDSFASLKVRADIVLNGATQDGTLLLYALVDNTLSQMLELNGNTLQNISARVFHAPNFVPGFATTATAAGTTTLVAASDKVQEFTGTNTQTIALPLSTTLSAGHQFFIINNSTGALTVNSSGGNLVQTIAAGMHALITCILNAGTSAASWDSTYITTAGASTSGQTLMVFRPTQNEPPAASFATPGQRNGHPTLLFDGAADEEAVFSGIVPASYAGGGFTLLIHVSFVSATSGTANIEAQVERVTGLDIDTDSFATFTDASATPNATSGIETVVTIPMANMDLIVAGDLFRLKIHRDADGTNGIDDVTTDMELLMIEVRET